MPSVTTVHPPSFSSLGMSEIESDSRGLNGHPCLTPFPVGIGSDNWPFTPSPFLYIFVEDFLITHSVSKEC